MVKKSKLLLALDAHKGRDYEVEKKRKQLKAGEKRKREKETEKRERHEDNVEPIVASSTVQTTKIPNGISKSTKTTVLIDVAGKDEDEEEWESESDADEEVDDGTITQPIETANASASEAEVESDVPLSDLEAEDLEDTVPHQRLTINNGPALAASTRRIAVVKPKMPFHHHNSLISSLPPSSDVVPNPNDDLTRELEFYRIAKEAVATARSLLKKENIPFTRPADYFAEMVKSDEHMGKVKKKMYDEAAGKKASEEAKKLRDARKFGKAVQVAKEQERAREKRGTLDKIKELKRKRKGQTSSAVTEGDDLFQEISIDNTSSSSSKRTRDDHGSSSFSREGRGSNPKRQKRDAKFGYGGKKRFAKSGDAVSSGDLSGFSARGMKGNGRSSSSRGAGGGRKTTTTKRLGKSRRQAGAGR